MKNKSKERKPLINISDTAVLPFDDYSDTAHTVPDFENSVKMKNFLVGVWHALPHVPAGYSGLYAFFNNGHFIYQFPEGDFSDTILTDKQIRTEGIWQYEKDGRILFKEKYKHHILYSDHCFTGYNIDYCPDEKVKSLKVAEVPENTLDEEELMLDRISFNGEKFWKISVDPFFFYDLLCVEMNLKNYNNGWKLREDVQ
ncbi:MAG: hypothetical protein V1904_15890 [Bacteroidota bacterium]